MIRRRLALAGSALLVSAAAAGLAPHAGADQGNYRVGDYADGQAMSILPPGENGLVNATDAVQAETSGTRPAGSNDQTPKYSSLIQGYKSLTDATLGNYYNDESFGVQPADITRTETPGPGTTIYRDTHDVPHVYGATDAATAFGAGYAQAEDRLFLMDVFRHYGAGNLSAFLGPSCAFEQMDHDQLLVTPYTKAQAQAQVDALPAEYGAPGAAAKSFVDNYVAGINAYIAAATTNPTLLPADYAAALAPPQQWSDADVVAVAGLIGGVLGKGGGIEFQNAGLLQYLQKNLGTAAGAQAFADFKDSNDPDAPTSIVDKTFPYEQPGTIDPSTTALPDNQTLTGGPTDTTAGCDLSDPTSFATPGASLTASSRAAGGVLTTSQEVASIANSLQTFPRHFSNALVVNASHSTGGHPIAVFGPQVSYFAPQIISLEDLHGPDIDAEGGSIPGTGIVELGRGPDFAWSATSAGTDQIDQRLEVVCDPAGGTPTAQEPDYLFNGTCLPMTRETFDEGVAITKPGGTGAPTTLSHDIYLTRHGVVQGWTTAGGKPVALVNQRSSFDHEPDSLVGFLMWNEPGVTHDATSWMDGAAHIGYTFNWLYVDDRDTAYYTSGVDPIRPANVDPSLPTWGTGGSEWLGFLGAADHPHEINPPQGFFVSWNNKPAPGFAAADDMYGYGPVYRSQMLVNQLAPLVSGAGRVTRAQVVQVMASVATQDLDGTSVLPQLLAYLGSRAEPAGVTAMLGQLQSWLADGAHRIKANPTDAQYQHPAAIAIMDELEDRLIEAVFDPLLAAGGEGVSNTAGGAKTASYNILPMQWANTPNSGDAHLGSAYDSGYESYLVKFFSQLRGLHVGAPFRSAITSTWCGAGGTAACPGAIDKALLDTYNALVAANGSTAVPGWTASPALVADRTTTKNSAETMGDFDAINFRTLGLVGQPAIEWQNRPTFQQVVEFPRHRARADTAAASAGSGTTGTVVKKAAKPKTAKPKVRAKAVTPTQPRRTLAFTGLSGGLGIAAVVLLLGSGATLRLRRRPDRR